jgi:hypothetical protein
MSGRNFSIAPSMLYVWQKVPTTPFLRGVLLLFHVPNDHLGLAEDVGQRDNPAVGVLRQIVIGLERAASFSTKTKSPLTGTDGQYIMRFA